LQLTLKALKLKRLLPTREEASMNYSFYGVTLGALLFLAACTSTPKKEAPVKNPSPVMDAAEDSSRIDYPALQTHLGLDRSAEDLGYTEKPFNTCEAGYGYSRSQNCHQEYFVVLHFRLLCRDSEGTISNILTDADTTPLSGRSVRWNLKGLNGSSQTDGSGFAQIRMTSPISQKKQRVKIAIGNEFLYMRANEITKVITPLPWCSQY
jgi:hypothetical protein